MSDRTPECPNRHQNVLTDARMFRWCKRFIAELGGVANRDMDGRGAVAFEAWHLAQLRAEG